MSQIFTIENDKVVIKKLALEELAGNLTVSGTLTVDNLVVKNSEPAQESALASDFGNWVVNEEADLLGKGFTWAWGNGNVSLAYRSGNRLWTNGDFDLEADRSYMVDNVPVLSKSELGGAITKSNLREVGVLRGLRVAGDATLGDFAVFNSSVNRLGLNTDAPNGVLSVVENDVELIVDSEQEGVGRVGTYSNSDLELVTDNLARITIKSGGKVNINTDVTITGTLTVDTLVSDNRIERTHPLEFKATRDSAIYGRGLIWTGTGPNRQFIMMGDPDRIWSSESLDLAEGQRYLINGAQVLSASALGNTVTQSNLSKLGTLETLSVEGEATFMSHINASRAVINATQIVFNNGKEFEITNSKINGKQDLLIQVADADVVYADLNEVVIGNKQNQRRPVKVFGPLTVGINTPREDVDLAVRGNINFANKTFITGSSTPTEGTFLKGDICWNNNTAPDGYVGWVCIDGGTPGRWAPFGIIARQ